MKFITAQEYKKARPDDKGVSRCPFCEEELDTEYLVRSNNDWNVIHPIKPIGGVDRWRGHLLLLPKDHHINETTLSDDERLSRQKAEERLEAYFGKLGIDYVCFVRLTDEIKSIQHLHYHYIGGDIRYNDIANSLSYHDVRYDVSWEKDI